MTDLTEERIRQIAALADGVTPGPYTYYNGQRGIYANPPDAYTDVSVATMSRGNILNYKVSPHCNGNFFAALDPDTIRKLCELALTGIQAKGTEK